MSQENAVLERYSEGANERQEALCCPVDYQTSLLKILPEEIIEKDYGCGDPSRYVREGDVVLDLGSGSGKICYMAAQLIGDSGKIIGVDMNDDMLSLARKYQAEMAEKIGSDSVQFVKGKIQDLALDVAAMEAWLKANPITNADELSALESWKLRQTHETPLIADNSVDLVISNCVLNLVGDAEKQQLVDEIFRVVKPGGRIAISDIISDEFIPDHLKDDDDLWSGCISGAFQEQEMLQMFQQAGFIAVSYDKWADAVWQVVESIEFRSATLTAIKREQVECIDKGHAVIYRGPYSFTVDDEGHEFPRGERMAVCERTFNVLCNEPYKDDFIGIIPAVEPEPKAWCAPTGTKRPAAESKGGLHSISASDTACC
ncbi:MAG TPA: methyltransferase domain-containing protein [Thiotrichaceae bacterium]|jgi:SAM-dependent methyltransferase|nr:methyltransferase domain-containing protein [Thiotrichaceae bacterium]HIM08926.1 methyltransferase domain-containing protein [Gammaproteobacteria bacterium]